MHSFRVMQNADVLYEHMYLRHGVAFPEIRIEWMEAAHRELHREEEEEVTVDRQPLELLQGGGEKGNVLDQWIDSLDHYVSTGAPMTLSAERTINLRALLVAVRDYINRQPRTYDDEPMSDEAWRVAGQEFDIDDDAPSERCPRCGSNDTDERGCNSCGLGKSWRVGP